MTIMNTPPLALLAFVAGHDVVWQGQSESALSAMSPPNLLSTSSLLAFGKGMLETQS